MKSYKYIIKISYDGSYYRGYGKQPHKNTIQDTLELILTKLNSEDKVKTFASSRTDALVHAKEQFVQFYMNYEFEENVFKNKLNKILPQNICVEEVFKDFEDKINVRYDVSCKTYCYIINLEKNPFLINYAYYLKNTIDIEAMREAKEIFVGTHDFSAFCNVKSSVKDKVRTINHIQIEKQKLLGTDVLIFTIEGQGFLYNMVRIIVGTLLEVGKGKITYNILEKILEDKKRTSDCVCVAPQGLYLQKIMFKENNANNFNNRR